MADMNHNLNEEKQGAAEEEEEKRIVLQKEDDDEAASDDSQKTEEPVPKPAFNPETGEIKINCRGICPQPLHYIERVVDSKEMVYGKKKMPRKIYCYICDEQIGGFTQAFYCPSGIKKHMVRFYCATCVLCQIQKNLKRKNEELDQNESLTGDTLIENVGKISRFTLK